MLQNNMGTRAKGAGALNTSLGVALGLCGRLHSHAQLSTHSAWDSTRHDVYIEHIRMHVLTA